MSIVTSIKKGTVGTPELQRFLNAIGQLSVVLSAGGNGLKCVAVPETGKFLYVEAEAAAAGTMKRTIHYEIQDTDDVVQTWYNGVGTITPAENCTDTEVGVPVVTGGNTIQFTDGVAEVEFAMDTDANATKGYDSSDDVTLTMAIPAVAGITVTVTNAVHTFSSEQAPLLWSYLDGTKDKTLTPSAAQANVAGAASMREYVELRLVNSLGEVQTWFTGHCHITATETCNDAQIGVPSLFDQDGAALTNATGVLPITAGVAKFSFAYDTDGDATKHYIATDFVTLTPSMDAIGGEAVTITDATVVATFAA